MPRFNLSLIDARMGLPNAWNATASTVLIAVGLASNLVSLAVIWFSVRASKGARLSRSVSDKTRVPRISGKGFLVVLLAANLVFLALHFYTDTLNRIILFLGIRVHLASDGSVHADNSLLVRLSLVDSNRYVCKVLTYLKNVSWYIHALTMAAFSIERFFAVYKPIKLIQFKRRFRLSSAISLACIIVHAFAITSFQLTANDLRRNLKFPNSTPDYVKPRFNRFSFAPSFVPTSCCFYKNLSANQSFLAHLMFVTVVGCYFIVTASMVLIMLKLRRLRRQRDHNNYTIKFTQTQSASTRTNTDPQSDTKACSSLQLVQTRLTINLSLVSINRKAASPNSSVLSFNFSAIPRRYMLNSNPHLIVSLCFFLINFPLIFVYFTFVYANSLSSTVDQDVLSRVRELTTVSYTSSLILINHSLTTFILLIYGRVFRACFRRFRESFRCSFNGSRNQPPRRI